MTLAFKKVCITRTYIHTSRLCLKFHPNLVSLYHSIFSTFSSKNFCFLYNNCMHVCTCNIYAYTYVMKVPSFSWYYTLDFSCIKIVCVCTYINTITPSKSVMIITGLVLSIISKFCLTKTEP